MALTFETFSNRTGGHTFFKAAGHPAVAEKARALVRRLAASGPVAVFDPTGLAATFAELYDLGAIEVRHVFVQDVERLGKPMLGRPAQPVTELGSARVATVLVAAFDADRPIAQIRHLLPEGASVVSFDKLRVEDALSNARDYLDGLNFATNFAFFRDADGHHSRVVTANYWHGYGATDVRLRLVLLDQDGHILADWHERVPNAPVSIVVDSHEIRERFDLPAFTGQLFMHVLGARGHDVVKYALDTYGDDDTVLSCTHDANAWPADLYAGLPAPKPDERVVLWVQNSHPCAIPADAVGLNLMGDDRVVGLDREVPAFGTYELDVASLFPEARWPQQFEIRAGKHFVRPRYEVERRDGRRRMAHVNVERVDLKPDARLAELGNLMGKGFILPAPVLPPDRYTSHVLPTPMATSQENLPIAAIVYDRDGRELARHPFGCLARHDSVALDIGELLSEKRLEGYGHVELVYDLAGGGVGDGWLHALFRYEDKRTGHVAETSFGCHMFNTVLTYKSEPQSYIGRPPGLSTRLFLRLGHGAGETLCHLIYPASTPWHERSATRLILHDTVGEVVAAREVAIPCSGSYLWRLSDVFDADELAHAGLRDGATPGYVLVRDTTCRLFGYHGVTSAGGSAFSFDHMFGF
ncbi:MAG: hypothetical protein ACE5Q3_02800 [Alphaproteobacteria bacterium]